MAPLALACCCMHHHATRSLAAKCSAGEADLDYFALEAAAITGLKLPQG